MGDPRKPRKKFETPRHPWRKEQLDEELHLLGEYGLRNKRELRRHETALSMTRGIARTLLGATEEERSRMEKQYLASLAKLGFLTTEATVDNILDLNVRDLMERRLQTMVFRNGLSKSIHQARQLVTHGHISIADRIVTVPGYIVRKEEETRIEFHVHSPLNNPNHPARGQPTAKSLEKPAPEVTEQAPEQSRPREPELPAVSREIAQEVEVEKPLEPSAVEESEGAEGEQNA